MEQTAWGGCAIPIPAGFKDLTGQNPEQPGLTSELALLGAGGWTENLLRFQSQFSFNLNFPVILDLLN